MEVADGVAWVWASYSDLSTGYDVSTGSWKWADPAAAVGLSPTTQPLLTGPFFSNTLWE